MIQQQNIPSIGLHSYCAAITLIISLVVTYHYHPVVVFHHLLGNRTILKTFHHRICKNLERISGSSSIVSKTPKKRGARGHSEGNSTISNSFFIHTVQLVSHRKEDEELALIKDQETTIKEAIFTLEDLDKVAYAEDLIILRKELAVAVLHQMKMTK